MSEELLDDPGRVGLLEAGTEEDRDMLPPERDEDIEVRRVHVAGSFGSAEGGGGAGDGRSYGCAVGGEGQGPPQPVSPVTTLLPI